MGLAKTLSGTSSGSLTNNNSNKKTSTKKKKKISINSHQNVFRNIYSKIPVLKSLFNKLPGLQPAALSIKRQVFYCEIIKNTIEHLRTTTSGRAQYFTKNGPNSNF